MSFGSYDHVTSVRHPTAQQESSIPLPSLSSTNPNVSIVPSAIGYQPQVVQQHSAVPYTGMYPVYSTGSSGPSDHHIFPPPGPPMSNMVGQPAVPTSAAGLQIHSSVMHNVFPSSSYSHQQGGQQTQGFPGSGSHTPLTPPANYQAIKTHAMHKEYSADNSDARKNESTQRPVLVQSASAESIVRVKSAPDFAYKLYRILQEPSFHSIVCWGRKGESFIVRNSTDFARVVLPQYFKHNNWASFVRQLNKYDFHKLKLSQDTKMYGSQCWEFQHPHFRYGDFKAMTKIRRKTSQKHKSQPVSSAQSQQSIKATVPGKDSSVSGPQIPLHFAADQVADSSHCASHSEGAADSSEKSPLSMQISPTNTAESDYQYALAEINAKFRCLERSVEQLKAQAADSQDLLLKIYEKLDAVAAKSYTKAKAPDFATPQPSWSLSDAYSTVSGTRSSFAEPAGSTASGAAKDLQLLSSSTVTSKIVPSSTLSYLLGRGTRPSIEYNLAGAFDSKSTIAGTLSSHAVSAVGNSGAVISRNLQLQVPWSRPPRVLLVEDDVVSRRLSSRLLHVFGCAYDVATDGQAAIEKINSGNKYDIVLMDIVMPKMDGLSATSRIRQVDRLTPIISMTSNVSDDDCVTYLATGMNDILPKPFNKATLLTTLQKYCSPDQSPISSPSGSEGVESTSRSVPLLQAIESNEYKPSKAPSEYEINENLVAKQQENEVFNSSIDGNSDRVADDGEGLEDHDDKISNDGSESSSSYSPTRQHGESSSSTTTAGTLSTTVSPYHDSLDRISLPGTPSLVPSPLSFSASNSKQPQAQKLPSKRKALHDESEIVKAGTKNQARYRNEKDTSFRVAEFSSET